MKEKDFLKQTVSECDVRDLAHAILLKEKQGIIVMVEEKPVDKYADYEYMDVHGIWCPFTSELREYLDEVHPKEIEYNSANFRYYLLRANWCTWFIRNRKPNLK